MISCSPAEPTSVLLDNLKVNTSFTTHKYYRKIQTPFCPLENNSTFLDSFLSITPNFKILVYVKINFLRNVLFETSSSKLKNSSYTELNKLVDILKKNAGTKVEIAGHTDSKGSKAGNDRISKARADVVVQYLGSKGISTKMLSAKGYGSSQPVATNDTAEGRAKNRRTEITVIK